MPRLALFDFDGTITTADTFTSFIYYAVEPRRLRLGKILLSPLIIAYKLGFLHASPVRSNIVRIGFRGRSAADVQRLGDEYARTRIPQVVRPKALERIKWHQKRGDTVVLVSASLDVYLAPWCKENGLELICTELEKRGDRITGRYLNGDCSDAEKAKRVRAKYDLASFTEIYAYGDTQDDAEMLDLAHKKYFRWREVSDANITASTYHTGSSDPNNAKRLKEITAEDAQLDLLIATQIDID